MVFAGAQVSWSGPELEQVLKIRGSVCGWCFEGQKHDLVLVQWLNFGYKSPNSIKTRAENYRLVTESRLLFETWGREGCIRSSTVHIWHERVLDTFDWITLYKIVATNLSLLASCHKKRSSLRKLDKTRVLHGANSDAVLTRYSSLTDRHTDRLTPLQ